MLIYTAEKILYMFIRQFWRRSRVSCGSPSTKFQPVILWPKRKYTYFGISFV